MAKASNNDQAALLLGELSRGRETAQRLRHMLRHGSELPAHQGLLAKILDSFSRSISILDEIEDSGENSKSPVPRKEKRGCYKRRRSSGTWVEESPSLVDDGYAWRKYGQKVILNAKHPRNYFRCTHKYDQGCQASKQVQKIQDDPPLYQTTYHDQHTCKHLFKVQDDYEATQIWTFGPGQHPLVKHEEDQNIVIFKDHPGYVASPFDGDDVFSCSASTHSMEMDVYSLDDFVNLLEPLCEPRVLF